METKVCKQCLEEKPLTSVYWHKNPWTKDWYCWKCKICRSKNNVEYRKTHKDVRQKWVNNNREHLQKYQKEYKILNQDTLKIKRKKYYQSVKDTMIKKYRNENVDSIREKAKKRMEEKWYNKLHHDTDRYIDKNNLRPDKCNICWDWWKIAAHHPNNDTWNKVVFCCYSCHQLIHAHKKECPKPIDLLTYKKNEDN